METTQQLYVRAVAVSGCKSDYEFSNRFGISKPACSYYRNGKSRFDDEHAEKIAYILGIDPAYVIACAHLERAKTAAAKSQWERIAKRFEAVAASLAVAAIATPLLLGMPASAGGEGHIRPLLRRARRLIRP